MSNFLTEVFDFFAETNVFIISETYFVNIIFYFFFSLFVFQEPVRTLLSGYLDRFSCLAGPVITCGPVLNWLELDNRGHRLIITDDCAINTPAVAAAYAVKRYAKQAPDEISFEVSHTGYTNIYNLVKNNSRS